MILVKKYNFFLCFVSVKIRLQIMFNNVLERKETFIGPKKFNLWKSPKLHFSKGVNPCFWSKKVFFSLFVFGQNNPFLMFNNVLHNKETFFGHKKFRLSKSQKSYFSKGVNPCFWSKNVIFFFICFQSK